METNNNKTEWKDPNAHLAAIHSKNNQPVEENKEEATAETKTETVEKKDEVTEAVESSVNTSETEKSAPETTETEKSST